MAMSEPADSLAIAHARHAIFDRVFVVISEWSDNDLSWIASELECGAIVPPPETVMAATCNGEGTCHGDATLCQLCGDVSEGCDKDDCPYHQEAASEEEEDADADQ